MFLIIKRWHSFLNRLKRKRCHLNLDRRSIIQDELNGVAWSSRIQMPTTTFLGLKRNCCCLWVLVSESAYVQRCWVNLFTIARFDGPILSVITQIGPWDLQVTSIPQSFSHPVMDTIIAYSLYCSDTPKCYHTQVGSSKNILFFGGSNTPINNF